MHGSTLIFHSIPVNAGSRQRILGFLPAAPEWFSPRLCIGCFQQRQILVNAPLSLILGKGYCLHHSFYIGIITQKKSIVKEKVYLLQTDLFAKGERLSPFHRKEVKDNGISFGTPREALVIETRSLLIMSLSNFPIITSALS